MPNRYTREGINDSKTINRLSWQGEVFYRRLMLAVDDFGRFEADTELLRCELFKRQLSKVSEDDIERLLAECQDVEALFMYVIGGKRFLVMNKWEQGRAKYSKYPPPPESVRTRLQMFADVSMSSHLSLTPTPSPSPAPGGGAGGPAPVATPPRAISPAAEGSPPRILSGAELIKLEKELVRVGEELDRSGSLADYQRDSPKFKRIVELRARQVELRVLLGVKA
jgi:hypothetical protein